MFDTPKLYISACSNSVQLVPLHPIIISILFHHYKQLKECISEFEQLETNKCSNEKGRILLMVGEEAQEEKARTGFVASNDNNDCQLDVFFWQLTK